MSCSRKCGPDTFVEEGVLAVNVAAIRKALSDGDEGQSYIETVPRRGYRFTGQVQAVGKIYEGGISGSESGRRKKWWMQRRGLSLGLIALMTSGFLWYIYRSRSISTSTPPLP
jgi:hypothetical protein